MSKPIKMDRETLLKLHSIICKQAKDLMVKKNHDYAGQDGMSPFANFERTELMGVCSTEKGFLVRVIDKISRLSTFADAGTLKTDNEGYVDAVLDIINYMILFAGFCEQQTVNEKEEELEMAENIKPIFESESPDDYGDNIKRTDRDKSQHPNFRDQRTLAEQYLERHNEKKKENPKLHGPSESVEGPRTMDNLHQVDAGRKCSCGNPISDNAGDGTVCHDCHDKTARIISAVRVGDESGELKSKMDIRNPVLETREHNPTIDTLHQVNDGQYNFDTNPKHADSFREANKRKKPIEVDDKLKNIINPQNH